MKTNKDNYNFQIIFPIHRNKIGTGKTINWCSSKKEALEYIKKTFGDCDETGRLLDPLIREWTEEDYNKTI